MSDEITIIPATSNGDLIPERKFDPDDLINQFLSDTQNLMENSKLRYRKSLKKYFEWVEASPYQLHTITLTELLIYKKQLEKSTYRGQPISPFTIGAYVNAIKIFYEWANGKGLMINPAKSLKAPKKETAFERSPLHPDQIQKLFEYFSKQSLRDYAIIKTLYYFGLRTIELVRLDIGDFEIKNGKRGVWVQGKGKTKKDRLVPFSDKAWEVVEVYLKTRVGTELKSTDPVFISEGVVMSGNRLITGTISKLVKKGLRAIGMDHKKYSAHSIRHSTGTNAMRKGASLEDVQNLLRHSDSKTTQIYTKTLRDEQNFNNSAADLLD